MPELFDVKPLLEKTLLKKAEWIAAAPTLQASLSEARKAFPGMFIYTGGYHFAVHRKSGDSSALFKVKDSAGF